MIVDKTSSKRLENLDPKHFIIIKGAKVNNLKNLSVAIPRNQLVVVTGLSGSGKSSLAFDTLFAEGQRMYVESLSSYARQFLGRMEKPEVEYIRGISPAIAVEQKQNTRNPRATIGTTSEIYDYCKLLFSRVGKTYSPISGEEVKKDTVSDVVNFLLNQSENQKVMILAPLEVQEERSLLEEIKIAFQKGFTRLWIDKKLHFIENIIEDSKILEEPKTEEIFLLIDRYIIPEKITEETQFRLADSVQTAFFEGHGSCLIDLGTEELTEFSDRFEADGMTFEEPSVQFFSFNSPYGACKKCGGFGTVLDLDADLIIPDKSKSLYEGVVVPWQTPKMKAWQEDFIKKAFDDFPIHRPYEDLSEGLKDFLWNGKGEVQGINQFFEYVASQSHKIQYRVMFSRYRGRIICPDCKGTRLRKDASYVKINGKSLQDLVLMPVEETALFFDNIVLSDYEKQIAQRILVEIQNRLHYLLKVGLGYLTLNRLTSSLSGGEYQRIQLATSLGSALVGSMYILDEPSIGLHPRDTKRLIEVLEDLKKLGNTVIVVEHEEEVMQAADQIIDIGPEAGVNGGELVFQGKFKEEVEEGQIERSYTLQFLKNRIEIPVPEKRRAWNKSILLKGARTHNLKNVDFELPLEVFTVVTGVSGSGKSTLVKEVFYPALQKRLGNYAEVKSKYDEIILQKNTIQKIEFIDQNPIGKSSRSNPATYTKVYDAIRQLFANQALAKQRAYTASYFSFNMEEGRCEACQGEGRIKIEMQFMADVYLTCEACGGKRFKDDILEVEFEEKNIADILELTIDEALVFFQKKKKIARALQPLQDVGLGYVRLGQPANTLSGGEAQRLKLASFLNKKNNKENILFIFDEPTTGLHFQDIQKLLNALNALIEQGHTVLVIEHNLEVIKSADWIVDLGPEGGNKGGNIIFAGLPEELIKNKKSHTGRFLKGKI